MMMKLIDFNIKILTPTFILNLNAEKKTFKLHLKDEFIYKNIQYYIAGEFSPTDATKPYNDKCYIRMNDNFIAPLFSQIEVKKQYSH
jgi:hypothetical protein